MDMKRMLEPEEDAEARASSGCSSQKWMLEPEVDARARGGCSSQKWMLVPDPHTRSRCSCQDWMPCEHKE